MDTSDHQSSGSYDFDDLVPARRHTVATELLNSAITYLVSLPGSDSSIAIAQERHGLEQLRFLEIPVGDVIECIVNALINAGTNPSHWMETLSIANLTIRYQGLFRKPFTAEEFHRITANFILRSGRTDLLSPVQDALITCYEAGGLDNLYYFSFRCIVDHGFDGEAWARHIKEAGLGIQVNLSVQCRVTTEDLMAPVKPHAPKPNDKSPKPSPRWPSPIRRRPGF